MSHPVRFKERDRKILDTIREIDSVREEAVERGIIEDVDESMTWEEVFILVFPEDPETMSFREEDMSWQDAGEAHDRILEAAGKNVPIHTAISKFTEQFAEKHGVDIDDV
jgi:hypothetical protein